MSTSSLPSIPTSPLQSVLNFRDVGKIVNLLLCGSLPSLKPDLFYRSARPDEASSVDRHALTDIYRVRTVIDLRSTTEHIEQASKRNENAQGAGLVATNDDEAAATVRIPGLKYIDINLNGGGFVRALLWKLSWGSLVRVLALITTGYRTQVIRILTTEVMNPRGLVGLGKDSLDYSKYEIRQVFEILADDKNYPILAHCTQGKDRTGLIVMLVLLLLDVPLDVIRADYLVSERELKPEIEERTEGIGKFGLGGEFARCPSELVYELAGYITEKYGGIQAYLESCGINDQLRVKVKANLLHSVQ